MSYLLLHEDDLLQQSGISSKKQSSFKQAAIQKKNIFIETKEIMQLFQIIILLHAYYLFYQNFMTLINKKHCQWQTISHWILKTFLFLIFLPTLQTSNPNWWSNGYIRAGKQTMISSISDYGTLFSSMTITYPGLIANLSSPIYLSLSLCSFIIQQVNELQFEVKIISIDSTASTVQMILNQSTVISSLSFQYLAVNTQLQYFDYKSVNWYCSNLANLNGYYRSQNITIPVSNYINTDSDGLQYNLYLETISMSNFNGSFFHFQQSLSYNLSHYVITIKTSDQNKITRVKISMILFRTNNWYLIWSYIAFYYHFLCQDANCFSNFVPVSTYTNPYYRNNPNKVYYGIRSFNFTKKGQKQYNIDLTQYTNLSINFQFSSSINFLQLEAFYIANRGCDDIKLNQTYYIVDNLTNITAYNVTYIPTYFCRDSYTCEIECNISTYKYPDLINRMCRGCYITCLTCSSYSDNSCLTCDPNMNRYLFGNKCYCKNGYLEIGIKQCVPCGNYMLGCTNCTSRTTCQSCKSGLTLNTLNNPDSCYCTNPSLFLTLNGSCISIDGCLSFLNESNIIKCTQCNTSALYYQINFTCLCQAGTSQVTYSNGVSKYCKIICGNGYVSIQQQCDDGNIINGDGCSSTCKIQNNFACYGELYNTSQCFQDIQLNLTYIGTLRNSISNRATLYFKVKPYRASLLKIKNTPQLINTTLSQFSSSQFEITFSQSFASDFGQMTMTFYYLKALQGKQFNLLLNLNKSGYFVFPTSECVFTVNQINSKLVYSLDNDNFLQFTQIGFLVLIGLGFLIFLISLFNQKMIGVQLMLMIQMHFFYLMLVDSIPIYLMPIQEILSYSNGYNALTNPNYFRTYQLPNHLIRSGFQKQFFENFNFMFLVMFLSFVLQFLRIIKLKICDNQIKSKTNKKKQYGITIEKDDNQSVYILSNNFISGRLFLCTGMILTNQIILSFIVESSSVDQIIQNQSRLLSNVTVILALLWVLIAYLLLFYYILGHSQTYNQSRTEKTISFSNIQKCYPFLFMTFQIIKIVVVGILYTNILAVYIIFALQMLYLIMLMFYRPYRQNTQYQDLKKNKSIGRKIDMLNYEDFQNRSMNVSCSSIHNFHNIFNSLGLVLYLILIILIRKISNENQIQELIGKVMLYLCFFHISISEILAILRLMPQKLTRFSECMREYILNCVKGNEAKLEQNNNEEEQRILKRQREKIKNKNKKVSKQLTKIEVQKQECKQKDKYHEKKQKKDNKIKYQQSSVRRNDKKKVDKNIKSRQKDNPKTKQKKQQGWLLKQVEDSQVLNIAKKNSQKHQQKRSYQKKIEKSPPKRNKKVSLYKN